MTMENKSFVAYYRVSTQRQGQSLIAEFKDVETGKNDNRPELLKAIQKAKETNSTLVIAKLDRLSRNLTFISMLLFNLFISLPNLFCILVVYVNN
jgi:DNA invertase Pin-like site-specific DNA recombinase